MFWNRKVFGEIASNARKLIFISPAHLHYFRNLNKDFDSSNTRVEVIPNGIDNSYFAQTPSKDIIETDRKDRPFKIIFASAFLKSKSLYETMRAIEIVRNRTHFNIEFYAYGKGLPFRKINPKYTKKLEIYAANKHWIHLENYLSKQELKGKYIESDLFVMPSKPETFGLVYVEALSQGLPIIYAKGQGFDGYYDDGVVGYAATPFDIEDIADKIEKAVSNIENLKKNISEIDFVQRFSWDVIAKYYQIIYTECI